MRSSKRRLKQVRRIAWFVSTLFVVACGWEPICSTPPPTHPIITPSNAESVGEIAHLGKGWTEGVAWSANDDIVAVATTVGIYLYDPHTLAELRFIDARKWVESVSFSPDGRILASIDRNGGLVDLWDPHTGQHLTTLEQGWAHSVGFNSDNSTLVVGGAQAIWLWDIHSGELLRTISAEEPSLRTLFVALGPDDTSVISPMGAWDSNTGQLLYEIQQLDESIDGVFSFALNPEEHIIALGASRAVALVDADTGQLL